MKKSKEASSLTADTRYVKRNKALKWLFIILGCVVGAFVEFLLICGIIGIFKLIFLLPFELLF